MDTILTMNQLLYVPFNHDFSVDEKIQLLLTEEEFFRNCFIKPDFDKEIDELISMSDDEIKAFEIDLSKEELIERYERQKREEGALYSWIKSNQNDIYCVKGDAGTGKSTFLHYLKYEYRNDNIEWNIVDLQKSSIQVSILKFIINIPHFTNLHYKVISSLIANIEKLMFMRDSEKKVSVHKTIKNLSYIITKYTEFFEDYFPNEDISPFFENLQIIINYDDDDDKQKILVCAEYIRDYFEHLFTKYSNSVKNILEVCIELYIYLLKCQNDKTRHMIAFDNFERFIGTDEIFSGQLTKAVIDIRNIQRSITNNNPNLEKCFQIIIFMRNTSTRMFTPLQISDLFPHIVDLSEWFQASKILERKIQWYEDNKIELENVDRLLDILNDVGGSDNKFRGLRSKLNMLFNNNKRVIINILIKVLNKPVNQDYIAVYDFFKDNPLNIRAGYARFAKRIVIFRLVLNELRNDDFFKHIIVQKNNNEKTSLGYARKILSILHEYKLNNDDDAYMNFEDIIRRLYGHLTNPISKYFNNENNNKRLIIAQVLYYMNYYDGRSDNWLQFIDIQYNIEQQKQVIIKDYIQLKDIIDKNYKNIRIRITRAGIAYLFFVVYSFEYFSCKSKNAQSKLKEFGNRDIPPILCVIPKKNEIKYKKPEELTCIKILNIISREVSNCIEAMKSDKNNIMFVEKLDATPIYHRHRIINSHTGFIDNYIYCMREIYKKQINEDEYFSYKFEELVRKMEKIRDRYKVYV